MSAAKHAEVSTYCPAKSVTSSMKLPLASTGHVGWKVIPAAADSVHGDQQLCVKMRANKASGPGRTRGQYMAKTSSVA